MRLRLSHLTGPAPAVATGHLTDSTDIANCYGSGFRR
jgi:hypothetical protein